MKRIKWLTLLTLLPILLAAQVKIDINKQTKGTLDASRIPSTVLDNKDIRPKSITTGTTVVDSSGINAPAFRGAYNFVGVQPILRLYGHNGGWQVGMDSAARVGFRDFAIGKNTAPGGALDFFYINDPSLVVPIRSGIAAGVTTIPLAATLNLGVGTHIMIGSDPTQEYLTVTSGSGTNSLTVSTPTQYPHSVRTVSDLVITSGNRTATSATASFSDSDVGQCFYAAELPSPTCISFRFSTTQVQLSSYPTQSGTVSALLGDPVTVTDDLSNPPFLGIGADTGDPNFRLSLFGQLEKPALGGLHIRDMGKANGGNEALRITYSSAGDPSRTVTDGVTTSGSLVVTSASANFTQSDFGRYLTGTGIPAGTWITQVTSPTQVSLSAAATASATGVSLTVNVPIMNIGLTPGNPLFSIFYPGSGVASTVLRGRMAIGDGATLAQAAANTLTVATAGAATLQLQNLSTAFRIYVSPTGDLATSMYTTNAVPLRLGANTGVGTTDFVIGPDHKITMGAYTGAAQVNACFTATGLLVRC